MNRKARRAQSKGAEIAQQPAASPLVRASDTALASLLQKAKAFYTAHAHDEAYHACLAILERYPYQPDTLTLLGLICVEKGDMAQAEAFFRESISRAPQNAYSNASYGYALERCGRIKEAILLYRKALVLDPDHVPTGQCLGLALQKDGQYLEALKYMRRTLVRMPEVEEWWLNYVEVFKEVYPKLQPVLLKEDEALIPLVTRCICESQMRGSTLMEVGGMLAWYCAAFSRLYNFARTHDEVLLKEEIATGILIEALGNPLMESLLRRHIMAGLLIEALLTAVRKCLLLHTVEHTLGDTTVSAHMPILSTLTQQLYLNEYVYNETPEETTLIETLAKTLALLPRADGMTQQDCWDILIYACYRPLKLLPNADAIAEYVQKNAIPSLKEAVEQTVIQPRLEMSLKKEIPVLNPLRNETSLKVQSMYEANPYPRWHLLEQTHYRMLRDSIRVDLPLLPEAKLPAPQESPEVLVAGCGTGKQAVWASLYTKKNVLAVDLSLSSLAYALYKTRELGISNIDYMQADILDLAQLGRQFDVIECSGVLHHMLDPMAGWRVLTSLLRTGGLMRIGLYSTRARESIAVARAFIKEKGYPSTLEGIRTCRQDIINGALGEQVGMIIGTRDFFVTSECRDLLFHVMEHTYTLPQISVMLDELGLELLGMISSRGLYYMKLYQEMFPQDKTQMSIANWDALEQKYPQAFAGMFQFWVRKK